MQAQHHRVCSLGEGNAFFVVSEQKDGDSADNSAASSYGLMCSGAVTRTHFSRPFTAPDSAFLRHLLGPDEGIKQLVFILVRSRFSLRFFSYHVAFCTLYLVAALADRAVDSTEVDFGARTDTEPVVLTKRYRISMFRAHKNF